MIIAGVVLAGGLARRMGGGDKGLRPLAGRPLLAWTIERARPQVTALALNANGDAARFAAWDCRSCPTGSLAMPVRWRACWPGWNGRPKQSPGPATWRASPPTRRSCRATLCRAWPSGARRWRGPGVRRVRRAGAPGVRAVAAGAAPGSAPRALEDGIRKVDEWTARYRLDAVEFAVEPVDPFFNVNRPEDLAAAERLVALAS